MAEKCKESVYDARGYYSRQCSRDAVKDGYCKQHHPDTIKKKEEARKAKWDAKWAAKVAVREHKARLLGRHSRL